MAGLAPWIRHWTTTMLATVFRPALFFRVLRVVGAVKKASLEQLDSYDGEDEVKEHVDHQDVDDVLEWVNDAVEHSLTTQQV